jgi:hypothetical protein
MTDVQNIEKHKPEHPAHVTVSDGEETTEKEVPAGPTVVAVLKTELGVAAVDMLFLIEHGKKRALGDDETIDVKSGEHFEVIRGGGVS